MESRAQFKTVSEEFLRSTAANSVDTGSIPTPVTSTETTGPANRGVEMNTARGVKEAPVIAGITPVTYGANTDAPVRDPYKTYGMN